MDILDELHLPYPRLCAHRGAHMRYAPENSIPAFEKAIDMGAPEIELDLWPSKDGEMFVFHNPTLEEYTGEKTLLSQMRSKEIKSFDIGRRFSDAYRGLKIPTFNEVLAVVAKKTILNIHVKSLTANAVRTKRTEARTRDTKYWYSHNILIMPPFPTGIEDVDPEVENRPVVPYDRGDFQTILDSLDMFECRGHAYIAGEREVLMVAKDMAPDMARCCLEAMNFSTVDVALRYDCSIVQFNKGLTTKAMVDRAHASGMKCNMFWSNDGEEACAYLKAGIDCILTDDYQAVSRTIKAHDELHALTDVRLLQSV